MSDPSEAGALGPGAIIGGFVIESVAGRGGMGVVYRARQSRPDRLVALKVISPAFADHPTFRARFRRESEIASQIEHPNVIPVHAVGEERGVLYIAMRFVRGTDLRALIALDQGLEPRRAAALIDQLAQALDAAHSHGLVHRDVKPANVLISTVGGREHVYLTDFGLSRLVDGTEAVTASGGFLGTIDYVAPEQARGDRVDARTDVYSMGCVLFQALTGTVPFPLANDLAKLLAHESEAPPSPRERAPEVPAAFEAVLARAMAKNPDDRYLSAGDLGRAAVAAASDTSLSRAERSVAVGGAAPHGTGAVGTPLGATQPHVADAVPSSAEAAPPRAADGLAPPSPARGSRRTILVAALVAVAVGVPIAIVAFASGGRDQPNGSVSRPALIGIVPGRSIGPVSLGEGRPKVTSALVAAGYKATPGAGPNETDFRSPTSGVMVVDFENNAVLLIQKFNDAAISVGGISINSTLRAAQARLATWRSVRCPKTTTLLIAPGGHTYFEFPHNPDMDNRGGSNGIVVSANPADRSFCG